MGGAGGAGRGPVSCHLKPRACPWAAPPVPSLHAAPQVPSPSLYYKVVKARGLAEAETDKVPLTSLVTVGSLLPQSCVPRVEGLLQLVQTAFPPEDYRTTTQTGGEGSMEGIPWGIGECACPGPLTMTPHPPSER